ncbi:MAG: response regulator transcription factor [Planctomycetales bacterium]|nr:response regulator transcription factor [Planctomycetales bacterium]
MAVSLLLVDERPLLRSGVRALLEGHDIRVVGEATSSDQAVSAANDCKPDVVLMAVRLSGADGIETIARLRANDCQAPVLCLGSHDNPTHLARAMAMGASGFLSYAVTPEDLVSAVVRAARGEPCWSADELKKHKGAVSTESLQGLLEVALTQRELEVLKQLAFGLSNKEIAGALGLRYDTIKEHVQHVLRKLGVNDRTQAAVWAVRRGLV